MPPKNQGKGKTPGATTVNANMEVSEEVMEEQILRLRMELDRKNDERNHFQLQRDKIQNFWKITNRQLAEFEVKQKILEKEIEDNEQHHQEEIIKYKQEIKQLLYDHKKTFSNFESSGLHSNEVRQKEQELLETVLQKAERAIKIDTQGLINETLVKRLEMEHEKEITETRNNWGKKLAKIKAKYEKDMDLVPKEMDNMRKKKTTEVEDDLKSHITDLKVDHKKDFKEVDVLTRYLKENLDRNNTLKQQITDLKLKKNEKNEAAVFQNNTCLTELLLKVKWEIEKSENEQRFAFCGLEKGANEKIDKKKLMELKSDCDDLEQKIRKLNVERKEINDTIFQNVQSVQAEESAKNDLLVGKRKALSDSLEKTCAQMSAVLSASNLDQTALAGTIKRVDANFDSHNNLPLTHIPSPSTRKTPAAQRYLPSEYNINTDMLLPRLTQKKIQLSKQNLKPKKLQPNHPPTISTKKKPAGKRCPSSDHSFMVTGETLPIQTI